MKSAVRLALEEELGVTIADEDINADLFATVGTLARFVEEKQAA
jgi:acyl carrier protein